MDTLYENYGQDKDNKKIKDTCVPFTFFGYREL